MNSFLSLEEIERIGFKKVGKNVLISKNAMFYQPHKISMGNNVRIDDFCILSGNIDIKNYIHIAAYTAIFSGEKAITIHDFANISSRVVIYSKSDDFLGESLTNPMIPDKYKKVKEESVEIGKHVIIGTGGTVLPGVSLGEGSSFGAMTLINKDSQPWSINVGIPFKKIRNREKKVLELERIFIEEQKNDEKY